MLDIETARFLLNEMWGRATEANASKSSRTCGRRATRVDDGWMRFEHALPRSAAREAKRVLRKYNLNKEQQRWILQLLFRIEADPRLDWRQKIRRIERYLVVPMTRERIRLRHTDGHTKDRLSLHDLATPSRSGLYAHTNGLWSVPRGTEQNADVASGLGSRSESQTIATTLTSRATQNRDYEFVDFPQHCSLRCCVDSLQPDQTDMAAGGSRDTSHCDTIKLHGPQPPTSQQLQSTQSLTELPWKDSEIDIDCKAGTNLVSQHRQCHARCLASGTNELLQMDIVDAVRALALLQHAALKLTAGQLLHWYSALIDAQSSAALISSALPIFESVLASRLLHAWRKTAVRAAYLDKYAKRATAMRTISILREFARRRSCTRRLQFESAAHYRCDMLQCALSSLKSCVVRRRTLRIATSKAIMKMCRRGILCWHKKISSRCRSRESASLAAKFRLAHNLQILSVHAKKRRRIHLLIARTQARIRSRAAARFLENARHMVLLVQHRWRMLFARQRVSSLRLSRAATCVQARTRGRLPRKAFQKLRRRVVHVQAHTRTLLQRRMFFQQKAAVVLLQATARAVVATLRLRSMKSASVLIQSLFRGIVAVRLLKALRKLACFLQCSGRRLLFRRKLELACSAVLIQSTWRGSSRWRALLQMRSACAIVQKSVRKSTCRRFYMKKIRVICHCQACARAVLLRSRFKKSLRLILNVQARFRRSIVCSWYASHTRSAISLQSLVRSKAARRHYVAVRHGVETVQKWVRIVRAKMQLAKRRDSLARLQRVCRDFYTKISLQRACITLQRTSRRLLMSRRFSGILLNIIRIQCFFRLLNARIRYLCIARSAALIQIHIRKARARYISKSRCLAVQSIQKNGRTFIARRMLRNRIVSIVRLQTYLRSWKQRKRYLVSIMSMYKVQFCVMKYTARRRRSMRVVATRRLQHFFLRTLYYFRRRNAIARKARRDHLVVRAFQTLHIYAQTVRSKRKQRMLLSCFRFLETYANRGRRARQNIAQMNQRRTKRCLNDWSARAIANIRNKVAHTKSANFYAFRRLNRGTIALRSFLMKRRNDEYSRSAALEWCIVRTWGAALSAWRLFLETRRSSQMRMLIGIRHQKRVALMRWSNQIMCLLKTQKRDQQGLRLHILAVCRASFARLRSFASNRRKTRQECAARMCKMADFKIRMALRNRLFWLVERRCACRYRMLHAANSGVELRVRNHLIHWRRLVLDRKLVQRRVLAVQIAIVKLRIRRTVCCWVAKVVDSRAELAAVVRNRAIRRWRDYAKTHIIKRLKRLQLLRHRLAVWYEAAMDMSVALSYYRDNLMQRIFSRWRLWSFGSRRILSNILQRTRQPDALSGARLQRPEDRDEMLGDVWMAHWQPTR